MAKKYVYLFTEGNAGMRELLGGKGANLAEMTNLGLPVPQGFTITTEACTKYYEDGKQINPEIMAQIMEYIDKMETITGKKFGDLENPLLVSVRSGARASMPGMMDTILNLGLNEDVVDVMAKKSGNPRWAWDCYRRFIQMYSDVVMEVGKKYFEQLIDKMKEERGVTLDVELTADDLKELASQFKAEYKAKIGSDFPTDPKEQLMGAVKAVFRSWDNPRANVYRRDNDIPYSWGTAVNVQMMAFGNMGETSGTGVAFTRDPATGEKKLMGEFLMNAQGEDVVAGIRTPMPIAKMAEVMPEVFEQFGHPFRCGPVVKLDTPRGLDFPFAVFDSDALYSFFMEIVLHRIRASYPLEQYVAGVVVALYNDILNEPRERKRCPVGKILPKRAPCIGEKSLGLYHKCI